MWQVVGRRQTVVDEKSENEEGGERGAGNEGGRSGAGGE